MARQLEDAKRAAAAAEKLQAEANQMANLRAEETARALEAARLAEAARRTAVEDKAQRDADSLVKKTEVCPGCRSLLQAQMDDLARQMLNDKEMYNNMRAERDRVQVSYSCYPFLPDIKLIITFVLVLVLLPALVFVPCPGPVRSKCI